jgi:hypothetical protein
MRDVRSGLAARHSNAVVVRACRKAKEHEIDLAQSAPQCGALRAADEANPARIIALADGAAMPMSECLRAQISRTSSTCATGFAAKEDVCRDELFVRAHLGLSPKAWPRQSIPSLTRRWVCATWWRLRWDCLCSGHLSGRPNRQLQRLAQSSKIGIPWAAVICFPEIDAHCADADLFSNVGNRQSASNASFTKIASERRLSRQG